MESVIRGLVIYIFLIIITTFSGKRTLAQVTTFDLILLLIISETTQQAMIDSDNSLTNGLILIVTLVGFDIFLSILKEKIPSLDKWIDGSPALIMENGKLNQYKMKKSRVDENDILNAARKAHGLENLEQIKHAILEKSGEITIVPFRKE